MTDTLIIVGLIWFAVSAVVLLPVCALLKRQDDE